MRVHLVDGTFELFRAYFGAPKTLSPAGTEVGATRGLLRSLFALARDPGVSHLACAFDHVIESFRNDLFPGYKTSAGVPQDLMDQFALAERACHALGLVVWPMIEFEADDALATGAARLSRLAEVEQVVICSPDKDLTQCVRGTRVVCFDRMRGRLVDENAVIAKFGVPPGSIPDWLALVGDSSDGYPGLPRWGEKSAAAILAAYHHVEAIPDDERTWTTSIRGAAALAATLRAGRADLMLYRQLATLREDVPLTESLDDLRWRGVRMDALEALCTGIGDNEFLERAKLARLVRHDDDTATPGGGATPSGI